MKNILAKISLLAAVLVMLSSCGGASSTMAPVLAQSPTDTPAPPPEKTTTPPEKTTPASSRLGACFGAIPDTKFVNTNGQKTLVVEEIFEGQTVSGIVELRPDDTRFAAMYHTISGGYITFLGMLDYTQNGTPSGTKSVYSSGYRLAVDMAVGQTVQLNYTDTRTTNLGTTVTNVTTQVSFVGLETLILGGFQFIDVCKLRIPNLATGESTVIWVAEGFGTIRSETHDASGVLVPGTRNELVTIESAA